MHVLVVEDEKKTHEYLKKGLMENGFVVDVAVNGEDGLHLALTADYDLIILDVMLPGRDGWSIIAELRRNGKQTQRSGSGSSRGCWGFRSKSSRFPIAYGDLFT